MAFYCFWSPKKESDWQLALASERHALETGGKAEFVTALDLDNDFTDPEIEADKVSYRGPFYLDFDAAEIEEAIEQVKKFLNHLVSEYEVNLKMISIYASGGKGFHIVIPNAMFISKPVSGGYRGLPAIYKEMAYGMYFDTMDLSVYTAKRGRMWRVTNFLRANGKHKVQLTPAEALEMTVEYYDMVTSVPRPAVPLEPPEINNRLELAFTQAKDRVERALKRNSNRKRDANLLSRFEGKTPPTLVQLMNGEGIKEDVGFQQIATQLAISAHGLGMSCSDFLTACEGLCDNHKSDSSRYGSFRLRQKELKRMYDYMAGNPTYDFSAGAIRALVDHPAVDLLVGEATDIGADGKSEGSITQGMGISQDGIFKTNLDGYRSKVCLVGMDNFRYLQDLYTREAVGYQVDVYHEGRFITSKRLTMDYFSSKQRFQSFTMSAGSSAVQATDNQVAALADVIRRLTSRDQESTTVYVVHREGLDLVPVMGKPGEYDTIWMSGDKVLSKNGISYAFVNGIYGGDDLPYKTDLLSAPLLPSPSGQRREGETYLEPEQVDQLRADLHNLFKINKPINVAKMLGWTMATFIAPILRKEFDKFPLLHLHGTSGAGKSSTAKVLARFQYHTANPGMLGAAGSTSAPLTVAATGSASMVFWLEEYKPSEMLIAEANRIKFMLRTCYDGGRIGRGRVAKESGDSQVTINGQPQVAPICFMAEFMETQKAIVERSICVALTEQDNSAHAEWFNAIGNPKYFGSVGRLLVETVIFKYPPEVFHKELRFNQAKVKEYLYGTQKDRPIYNLAVAATGLRLLQRSLAAFFGDEFNAELEDLINCLINPSIEMRSDVAPVIKSEIVSVINTMAFLSKYEDVGDDARLMMGRDYAPHADYTDIHARKAYHKYQRHCSVHREKPLFMSSDMFVAALNSYSGATKVSNSLLGPGEVYRLDHRRIYDVDRVEEFDSK